MTENAKKFIEAVSCSEKEKSAVNALKTKEELIAYAKDKGFTLTNEDFEKNSSELGDDELNAVAGGTAYECSGFGIDSSDYTGPMLALLL